MTQKELTDAISKSLREIGEESPLFQIDRIGERALVFRLCFYLQKNLSGIIPVTCTVDVEYNILPSSDPKALAVSEELRKSAEVLKRTIKEGKIRVVPDILVHERNSQQNNLAVIEVKFANCSKKERCYVRDKIKALVDNHPFKYAHGVLLLLPRDWQSIASDENIKYAPDF
jgi:hypothetical protein